MYARVRTGLGTTAITHMGTLIWTQNDQCDIGYVQEGGFSLQTTSDVNDVPHARPLFAYACNDLLIFPLTLESKGVIQGYKPNRGGVKPCG